MDSRQTALDEPLRRFNAQVLRHQNEAYTLACYLLGSSARAEHVVEAAVRLAYARGGGRRPPARLDLLRLVIAACGEPGRTAAPQPADTSGLDPLLLELPPAERRALVLVDVLGLCYAEAARVLDIGVSALGARLANARWLLRAAVN